MKRIGYLFLFVTLFYNALGYYLMFSYQEEQEWVSAMEKTPDEEFKVIELNATLYSFIEDTDFEYVNENVIIENKSYHIFKKRIKDNILSLYYLPNSYGDVIGKNLNEIVDNQLFNCNSKDSPVKRLLKSFLQDYIPNTSVSTNFSTNVNWTAKRCFASLDAILHSGHLIGFSPPPELI